MRSTQSFLLLSAMYRTIPLVFDNNSYDYKISVQNMYLNSFLINTKIYLSAKCKEHGIGWLGIHRIANLGNVLHSLIFLSILCCIIQLILHGRAV